MKKLFPAIRPSAAALAAVMILVAGSATGDLLELQWDDAGQYSRELGVAPGQFSEVCGKLDRGQSIAWRFEANAPLNFNVHYHEGAQVMFPVKQDAVAKADGKLIVQIDQDYCWMWTNKSAKPVDLRLTLRR